MKYAAATELDWVRERLGDPYSGVTAIVPAGFDAYVRMFHPAESDHGGEPSRSWAEIAEQHGRVMHAGAQFHAIATPAGQPVEHELNGRDGPPGRHRPNWGCLGRTDFSRLTGLLGEFTTTARDMVCCLWEGYGGVPEPPDQERVQLPFRGYLVLRGDVGPAAENWFAWAEANGQWPQTPNLFWPADRAWCVATEIDFAWTLIGCSAEAAAALVAHPDLEAWPIEPTASVLIDGDRINL